MPTKATIALLQEMVAAEQAPDSQPQQAPKNIESEIWGDIKPFAEEQKSSAFPFQLLPDKLGNYVKAVGECLCIYPEMGVLPLFTALSTAVQKKAKVELYTSTAIEPLNLYCLTVAPPSQRKSPCAAFFLNIISQWEQERKQDPQIMREISEYKANKAYLDSQLRKATNKGDLAAIKQYQTDIDRLTPKYPLQLMTNDVTPESLTEIMAKQGEKISILDSEGTILDILSGMYSPLPNLSLFLKAYSGERVDNSRKGRDTVVLYEPTLTIGIFSQNGHFEKIIKNERFRERGLMQRFIYSFPKDNFAQMKAVGTPIPESVRNTYSERIIQLLEWQPKENMILHFTEPAKKELAAYFDMLKAKAAPDHPYSSDIAKEWIMKQLSRVQRIAALLHLAVDISDTISAEETRKSILISHWLEEQAAIAFGIYGTSEHEKRKKQVARILKCSGAETLSKSELLLKVRTLAMKSQELSDILASLDDDHNMIKFEFVDSITRGRKTQIIRINPKLKETDI